MFNFFRRKPQEEPEELTREEIEYEATKKVLGLIEEINKLVPELPYGTLPWMDWSTRPPSLKLKRRRYDADEIVVYHEQKKQRRRA